MIHTTEIDIRFADIDAFNHVNNAKYITYLEHARMKFVDEVIGQVDWANAGFILARAEMNYIQPVKLYDKIIVETHCSRIGNKSFDLTYKILKIEGGAKTEMANAVTVQVGFDYKNNRTIAITEEWREKLGRYGR
jgi:acyl-CoA thioester hydrolase